MKVPKSFVPDSFEPDPPKPPVVTVQVTSQPSPPVKSSFSSDIQQIINSVPTSQQSFHPAIQEVLSQIENQGSSVGLVAWLKKHGANQRAAQYNAQSSEVSALIGLASSHHAAYINQVEQAFTPIRIQNRMEVEFATHQVSQKTLEYNLGLIVISEELAKRAIAKGQSLEVYIAQLQKDVELHYEEHSGRIKLDQAVEQDQRLKDNARKDENLKAIDRINRATDAKMAIRLQEKQLRQHLDEAYGKKNRVKNDSTLSDEYRNDLLSNVEDEIIGLRAQIDELLGRPRQTGTGQDS